MRSLLINLFLISLVSCASRFIIPGNRFYTPETQGGALKGAVEYSSSTATQLIIDDRNASVEEGLISEKIGRNGTMLSLSVMDPIDLIWTRVNAGSSLLGAKLQFLGTPRSAKAVGHEVAFVGLFGSNKYETDDETIKFTLDVQEYSLVYGYRVTENILPYASITISTYQYDVNLLKGPINGVGTSDPSYTSKVKALNLGSEFSFNMLFVKPELTYQLISTTDSATKTNAIVGVAFGVSW